MHTKDSRNRFIGRLTPQQKEISKSKLINSDTEPKSTNYSNALSLALFGMSESQFRQTPILPCTKTPLVDKKEKEGNLLECAHLKLDARDIVDNFYLNLLAWSKFGLVYIALKDEIYSYNTRTDETAKCTNLEVFPDRHFTAVGVGPGNYWFASANNGIVSVLSAYTNRVIATKKLQDEKIVKFEPTASPSLFYMGGSYTKAYFVDLRSQNRPTPISQGEGNHAVCGLSYNGNNLLACGNNDNIVKIWDIRNFQSPVYTMSKHTAAVKALAFHPKNEHLIASGGGTTDRYIRLWDTTTGNEKAYFTIKEPVTSVLWTYETSNCLFSTHGHLKNPNKNSVCLWDLSPNKNLEISSSTVKQVTKSNEHNRRVLCSARAPGKDLFCTVSADETLRFWKLASPEKENKKEEPPYFSSYLTLR